MHKELLLGEISQIMRAPRKVEKFRKISFMIDVDGSIKKIKKWSLFLQMRDLINYHLQKLLNKLLKFALTIIILNKVTQEYNKSQMIDFILSSQNYVSFKKKAKI